ncbi:MAG: hypothetical protein ACI8S6_003409 [Myxococcota bacterium]|jgi:hypothetical protein
MSRPLPPPMEPLARRTALDLPQYRYVPGLNPHPFRHHDGHSYTDGSAPPEDPEQLPMMWLYGCDLFDHRFYWEAHEAWEACWHHAPPGPRRELLQGLIQAAAAILKRHMGHERAAARLLAAAAVRLQAAAAQSGGRLDGLDIAATQAAVADSFAAGDWPLLVG